MRIIIAKFDHKIVVIWAWCELSTWISSYMSRYCDVDGWREDDDATPLFFCWWPSWWWWWWWWCCVREDVDATAVDEEDFLLVLPLIPPEPVVGVTPYTLAPVFCYVWCWYEYECVIDIDPAPYDESVLVILYES